MLTNPYEQRESYDEHEYAANCKSKGWNKNLDSDLKGDDIDKLTNVTVFGCGRRRHFMSSVESREPRRMMGAVGELYVVVEYR
ncbi:hypothetical protein Tco_1570962 [Tanacetum coccineum]